MAEGSLTFTSSETRVALPAHFAGILVLETLQLCLRGWEAASGPTCKTSAGFLVSPVIWLPEGVGLQPASPSKAGGYTSLRRQCPLWAVLSLSLKACTQAGFPLTQP